MSVGIYSIDEFYELVNNAVHPKPPLQGRGQGVHLFGSWTSQPKNRVSVNKLLKISGF
jgi:hypothetical protein